MTIASKIKIAKNTNRVERELDEPLPPIIEFSPKAPEILNEEEAKIWDELVPKLVSLQIFTTIDHNIFIHYCKEMAMYNKANLELEKNGFINITQAGYETPSPWVGIKNKCLDNIIKISKEFGLSPAARTKISVSKSQPKGIRASIQEKIK